MNKAALKPVRLEIGIAGEGNYDGAERPFPWQYINDALSQNILWYAYREPKTVEELSELTGVPAFYIEDSITNLRKREAVIRPTKSTVQTDFLIFDEQIYQYEQACANQCAEDVSEKFYLCAQGLTEQTLSMGIYTADKSFDELLCLFSLLTLDDSVSNYPPAKYRQPKVRYDGHRWEYLAQATHAVNEGRGLRMIDMDKNMNGWVPESYSHYVYRFSSFLSQKMMYDHEIAVCAALLQGKTLSDSQKETAAAMVINGYLKRDQDKIIVSMPVFTAEQYTKFRELASSAFHEFLPIYQEKIRRYVDGYIKLFPSHLKEAASRNGFHIFVSMFARIAAIWMRQGKMNLPDDAVCDVLIEHAR